MADLHTAQVGSMERVTHPCDMIQRNYHLTEQRRKLHEIRSTQGWAAAARVSFDQAMLLRSRRIGAMPTSHALYHHYVGSHDEIKVEDVYGLAKHDPNVQPAPRAVVERDFYGEELVIKSIAPK